LEALEVPVPNPVLNEKSFSEAATAASAQPGWGAPTRPVPPSGDPASPWRPTGPTPVMTVGGTATATGVLLVLLCAAATFGWQSTEIVRTPDGSFAQPPGWVIVTLLAGVGLGILGSFKPMLARFVGPAYALLVGTALGAISKVYETAYQGIVLQAVIGTLSVLGVMLFLHATRILKVTDRFRRVIVYSTGAIFVVYMASLVMHLFGGEMPYLHDASPLGIGISLVIIVIAAFNLSLDFDLIERGVASRAPKQLEWYGALGLVMTLVWLYLEILRLLSKLQQR
jgi:uncharacterized YccA/Bax inhibitor family protein